MECGDQNKCQCKTGFHEYFTMNSNLLECVFYLPEECKDHTECGPHATCIEDSNKCDCHEGFSIATIDNEDIEICIRHNETEVDLKCPINSQACSGKCCSFKAQCSEEEECVCPHGMAAIFDRKNLIWDCEPEKANQTQCPQECGPHSECMEGECKCLEGYANETIDGKKICKEKIVCDKGFKKCSGNCCSQRANCVQGRCLCSVDGSEEIINPNTSLTQCPKVDTTTNSYNFLDDLFDFDNLCQNSKSKCSKTCCTKNAYCNQAGECVCISNKFIKKYTKLTKAMYCEEPPYTYERLVYFSLGGVCTLLAFLYLCAKCCLFCKNGK
ncbi:uncharacterized protein [Musca autumnalis]|uniref:uncharacterized protein n=1 Tax=Musca autumnalis TaxID=221902 RepID=UPI003CF72A3C